MLNFASSSHLACTSLEVSPKGFSLERFPTLLKKEGGGVKNISCFQPTIGPKNSSPKP